VNKQVEPHRKKLQIDEIIVRSVSINVVNVKTGWDFPEFPLPNVPMQTDPVVLVVFSAQIKSDALKFLDCFRDNLDCIFHIGTV
jgi:hypothetical protein